MEITTFTTQDGRGQLQNLRRLLARAVTDTLDNPAKIVWLFDLLTSVQTDVTADASWSRVANDTDDLSHNTQPKLIAAFTKAVSESSMYGGDYKTQLLQDIIDAKNEFPGG